MNRREAGFLLLTSHLGDPERKVLSVAQLRRLAQRVREGARIDTQEELTEQVLLQLGYGSQDAQRILELLSQEDLLDYYWHKGAREGCVPITRVSGDYPLQLHKRLGLNAPGCLWAKGDLSLLQMPMVALVGSRELNPENLDFAWEVGRQAALQGYTLVSGNAKGADRTAQDSCLASGGRVISVVADSLLERQRDPQILYLSEDGFDLPFSAQRALSRNRVIHCLADCVLIAQCNYGKGGTWDGTIKNLQNGWSSVFCFGDDSPAIREFSQMGATLLTTQDLTDLPTPSNPQQNLFD